jgi:basic amino acid/polyamine antiporter, APA family
LKHLTPYHRDQSCVLRAAQNAERPYRALGYPIVQILYIAGAAVILALLFVYRPATTLPGLAIVLIGVPVFVMFRRYGSSGV